MLTYFLCAIVMVISIAATHFYDLRKERKIWDHLEEMIDLARNGTPQVENINETSCSSIENAMRRLWADSCLAKENIRSQQQKIQTLISDISHQTITPISNIILYSQLLEEQAESLSARTNIKAIQEQTEKLNFLIESLVKTSRLENGIIKTHPSLNSVTDLLQGVIAQAKKNAGKKNITVTLNEPEKAAEAYFDFKWTEEAVYNILDNSIKYTQEYGEIAIHVVWYPMFCRIDIADNGVGIEEEELPKIFSRFYRCGRTSREKGVGLGLYLARKIISTEYGYIKVVSELGKGSTFSIFLPESDRGISKVSKV